MGILGHVTSRANARVAPTTPYAFTDRSVMHADQQLKRPNGTFTARKTVLERPLATAAAVQRTATTSNALRTHDRLASQPAKQLPLMHKKPQGTQAFTVTPTYQS